MYMPVPPLTAIGPHYKVTRESPSSVTLPDWTVRAIIANDGSGRPTFASVHFYGYLSETRAREYASWMNSQEEAPPSPSFKVGDHVRERNEATNVPPMTVEHIMPGGTICLSWVSETSAGRGLHAKMINACCLVLATE